MIPKNIDLLLLLLGDNTEGSLTDFVTLQDDMIWRVFGLSIKLKHDKTIVVDYEKFIQQIWNGDAYDETVYLSKIGQQTVGVKD